MKYDRCIIRVTDIETWYRSGFMSCVLRMIGNVLVWGNGMHRIQKVSLVVAFVAVSGLFLGSCSKNTVSPVQKPYESQAVNQDNNGLSESEQAKGEQPEPAKDSVTAKDSEETNHKSEQDGADSPEENQWKPAEIDLNALLKMDAIEAEKAILASFSSSSKPDTDEILAVKQKADAGDDASIEKLSLFYLGLPATDSRHDLGNEYLKKLTHIESAQAYYLRGVAEYDNNGENVEKARPYLKKAMEMDYEPALRYLNDNLIFDLHDEALKKLSVIYQSKVDDPKRFLEFIDIQELPPDEREAMTREYVDNGIKKNIPDAYYARGSMYLSLKKDREGLDLLKKSAELGSNDGNALMAALYTTVDGASNVDEALDNSGLFMYETEFSILKEDLSKAENKTELIDKYIKRSMGNMLTCELLVKTAASEDETPQVAQSRSDVIKCIQIYLNKNHTRSNCEYVYSLTSYADDDEHSFDTIFSDEERQTIGESIIGCLNQALTAGDNYTDEGPTALSTALRISGIYAHDNVFNIPEDKSREIQYLIYAAYHDDPIAQSILSQNYLAGKGFKEDLKRACYWGQRVTKSSFCTEFCRESEDVSSCDMCVDAKEVMAEACAKP